MFPYNPQSTRERLDSYIAQLQQMKDQIQPQPTNLTQNFSLTPQTGMRYANSMDDVVKETVFTDTPFFSSDLSVVWIKDAKGNIKPFEMKEIVQKDEKDMIIESLQYQLNEMNKKIKELGENAKSINANDDESIKSEESPVVSKVRATKTK